jgi:ABC-type antimicrobial peptide transport system permease subunit
MLNERYRWRTMAYAVRSTRVGTPGFLGELKRAVWLVNPNLPLAGVQTVAEIRAESMAQTSFALVMLGIGAAVALLIGVVGIYGVIAYAVAQRTREIGIRMALGAHRGDVFALIMRQGAMQTALAIAVGLLLSLGIGRVLSQILYGVSPSDPFALIISSLMLAVAALLACFLPARRATYVNPITALRTE